MRSLIMLAVCVAVAASLAVPSEPRNILGNRENFPGNWMRMDRANAKEKINFMIAVTQQNLDALDSLFWAVSDPDSPLYQQFQTVEQIDALVAPKAAHISAIEDWLEAHGATDFEVNGDAIRVSTTVRVAETLFQTQFYRFGHVSGKLIVRQVGAFSVPKRLAVDLVSGLSEFPISRSSVKRPAPVFGASGSSASVVPATLLNQYSIPAGTQASANSSQGVIEFEGQSYSPNDLQKFATEMGITIPALSDDHVVGPNEPSEPQIEATLDIEYIAAVGAGATNWFWLEKQSAWLYGWANNFYKTSDVPYVVSISYGWNEEQQCQDGIGGEECSQLGVDGKGYVQRVNTEFQKIGLRGVSILTASGDSGANGRTDSECFESHLNPVFPGASPFVTSTGATQFKSAETNLPNPPPACRDVTCASSGEEVAVSYAQAHFASGGGFSNIAGTPSYQASAVKAYLNSGVDLPPSTYYNASGRGFPDVAALGSNILITTNGRDEPVGGTSASAPIFAGVIALLNDFQIKKTGKPLGFLNPLLYKMADAHPAAFNDITEGDNKCTESGCHSSCKGYECAKGWDPVTGLGSPVYSEMLAYLKSQ